MNTLNNIPEHSLLYNCAEKNDYSRCIKLHLPFSTINVSSVSANLKSAFPKWLYKLIGKNFSMPLKRNSGELIFGANLKHLEWRISILQDRLDNECFNFLVIINYNNNILKYLLWPLNLILTMIFKNALKNLKHVLQNIQ